MLAFGMIIGSLGGAEEVNSKRARSPNSSSEVLGGVDEERMDLERKS